MKEDAELIALKLRICKMKFVEFFLYIGICITLCLSIIFNWTTCRYITYMALCLTIISDLVVENLLYKDYIFLRTEDDKNEK